MTWLQDIIDIDSMFPWLTRNLRTMTQRVTSLKDCQIIKNVPVFFSSAKKFIEDHPNISLFLAILTILGFLPFFVILVFVSSSFVFVAMSALAVVVGTLGVALFSFLVLLSPVLVTGGIMAVFVYFTFYFIKTMLQIIKGLKHKLLGSRRSRRVHRFVKGLIQSVDSACFPAEYEHSLGPVNEEPSRKEPSLAALQGGQCYSHSY